MILLPFSSGIGDFVQYVDLDGSSYEMHFQWNNREESWYCNFGLFGEDPVTRFKVRTGYDLVESIRMYDGMPKGKLFCVDIVGNTGRVDIDGIGMYNRYRLVYFSEEESLEIFTY